MAYRFKLDEPLHKGFRRVAGGQIEIALAELSEPEIGPCSVHECRKSLKRLRALIRLAGPALGAKIARQHNAVLSDAARLLSPHRDHAVVLETIKKLEATHDEKLTHALAAMRAALEASHAEEGARLDADVSQSVQVALTKEAKRLLKAKLKGKGFSVFEGGLEECYRSGRDALKTAYSKRSDEAFHELRKAVQWHWRQMTLLTRAWPEALSVRIEAARELSQILGDHQDLVLLETAAKHSAALDEASRMVIWDACEAKRRVLRDAARFRAERLFAEPPKVFVRRIEGYWHSGRRITPLYGPASTAENGTSEPV